MSKQPKPAMGPNLVCPFTGQKIEVVRLGAGPMSAGFWVGRVAGLWQTGMYQTKQPLLYALATRGGVPPAFPQQIKVTMSECEAPAPDPLAAVKEKERDLDEAVLEAVDRLGPVLSTGN